MERTWLSLYGSPRRRHGVGEARSTLANAGVCSPSSDAMHSGELERGR
jgi:hypothetical protein